MPEENKNTHTGKPPMWVEAIRGFGDITAWIAVPVVVALVAGKFLDKRYGTEPVLFLVLVGAGFIVTCYGIVRIAKEYSEKLKRDKSKTENK